MSYNQDDNGMCQGGESDRTDQGIPMVDDELRRIVDNMPDPQEFAGRIIGLIPPVAEASVSRAYLEEIGKLPSLSESCQSDLVMSLKSKNEPSSRKRLNEANLRLVAWIAKEYALSGASFADLINEGTIGLIQAVESFNPEAGRSFPLHAAACIRNSISRAVAYETSLNRLPDYLLEKITSIKPISKRLCEQMGRQPTMQEVAGELGLTEEQLDRLVKLVGHAPGSADQ